MDRGLSRHLESIPTPHLAMTVNTITISPHESHNYQTMEVSVIDRQEWGCGRDLEDAMRPTGEEWKAEGSG